MLLGLLEQVYRAVRTIHKVLERMQSLHLECIVQKFAHTCSLRMKLSLFSEGQSVLKLLVKVALACHRRSGTLKAHAPCAWCCSKHTSHAHVFLSVLL